MGAAALQPHSGVVLKDSSEGKFSCWAEFRVMHLFTHFTRKRWPEVTIYPERTGRHPRKSKIERMEQGGG